MHENQIDSLQSSPEEVVENKALTSVGFIVVDRDQHLVLRHNDEFHRLGASVKSSPIVFVFRDQALNALIDHTIKNRELRANVMDVTLDHRQKIVWPDDWLAAREATQAQARRLAEELDCSEPHMPDQLEQPVVVADQAVDAVEVIEAVEVDVEVEGGF